MTVVSAQGIAFDGKADVLIVGGGACGLCAALAAHEMGAAPLVIERDSKPTGSTALSTGLIPAAGTRLQREAGIDDSAHLFAQDILAKARGETSAAMAALIAGDSGATLDWLMERHGVPLSLVQGFLYPGHSRLRMHGTPGRTGSELQAALLAAAGRRGIDVLTGAHAEALFADDTRRVRGVRLRRRGGGGENVGCRALVLACNGFGGNPAMVGELIPEMAGAPYQGHAGNQGDAVIWGRALGAALADLGSYQGHGAVAHPEALPVVWAVLSEGGIQVNRAGERFANEMRGYSEQAVEVIRQDGSVAWNVYDSRCEQPALEFSEYLRLKALNAVKTADSAAGLAAAIGLPAANLGRTLTEVRDMALGGSADPLGRDFTDHPPLEAPYCAIRVTGALFHTQGGLVVDEQARVLREGGGRLPNLFAGGGAARGLSGPSRWGYLSGNGLLTATVLGRIAGREAARLAAPSQRPKR